MRTLLLSALLAAVGGSTAAVPLPAQVVVASSTVLTPAGSEGYATTVTNLGDESVELAVELPAPADEVQVDTGTVTDGAWTLTLLPGATGTLEGR